jgi:TldD protein
MIKLFYGRYFFQKLIVGLLLLSFTISLPAQQVSKDQELILKAMEDELNRSMKGLKLKDLEKPSFIEYSLEDTIIHGINSVFGALVSSTTERRRLFHVNLRVGDYASDKKEINAAGELTIPLVVEDDLSALKQDMWLATDFAYKIANQNLAGKKAAWQNIVVNSEYQFPREKASVNLLPLSDTQFDKAKWEKMAKEWSAIFKEHAEIEDSGVNIQYEFSPRYLVNSEGTKVRQSLPIFSLSAWAKMQSKDGLPVSNSISHYAPDLDKTSTDFFTNRIKSMVKELFELSSAKQFEDRYIGPVLFTGQASPEMFSQLLAPNLSGEKLETAEGDDVGELADRIGKAVLPNFLSVYDDPTVEEFNNQKLIGTYKIDDQGVEAQRTSLIENGILKGLLMSRTTRKEFPKSNGHGRAASIGDPKANIGNLFIEAKDGKSEKELKEALIKECKAQQLPYGIWIKALEPTSTPSGKYLTQPAIAYKIYVEDGKEELVNDLEFGEISVRTIRRILAAGKDQYVYNTMTGGRGGYVIVASIMAPSVLFEELELKGSSSSKVKPNLLNNPYFAKKENK